MANSLTWKPPTFKVLLFVCLFAILLRLAFPATFSLLVSEQPLINVDMLFISCIFPEIAISASWFSAGSEEMAVLVQTELTLFLPHWWSAFPPLSIIFIWRNFFSLKLSNKLFLSLEASDFRVWTSMVPNLQTLSCLTYFSSFSIAPLLINHSTSDKENNKFFCWEAARDPSVY